MSFSNHFIREEVMSRPEQIIRGEIRTLKPYHVPSSTGLIKLDAMENPYTFPESLREGLAARLSAAPFNRYPDADGAELKAALRRTMNIPAELDILLGNGSDEIIQMIALACAKPQATLLSIEPAFVMFRMIATFCGLRYVGVPLTAKFEIDLDATLEAIQREQPALVFIAYPNNPTGNLFDRQAIERLIEASPGLVVIDEAYFAFSSQSFLDDIDDYPNVVLMRTVSKLGLAGLRLGFLVGHPGWISAFDKLRLPYNINTLTQAAATYALEHYDVLQNQTAAICKEKARIETALDQISAIERFPSAANFILLRVPNAAALFDGLLARGILVKNVSQSHALLNHCLRITIGTAEENDAFIDALQAAL